MEGVLVKAKAVGGTITVTVVSDEHGHYAFPADRLKPGHTKSRSERRVLTLLRPRDLSANASTVDLKLSKVDTTRSDQSDYARGMWK